MPFCVFFKMVTTAILNFQKVLFWSPCNLGVARIYLNIKFGANRSRIGHDMPSCVFSKMAAADILNFQKMCPLYCQYLSVH